ncbi:hypothetical protein Tco_1049392, partial [Tanacetum coccineum]
EYLLEFTSEYDITEDLHPELPSPEDRIVDFPEGKVGVYTKFFEFANFRVPISQFLFDILGHYQIHLSQLSVIGAAKVSHFEINCRVLNINPSLNLFRVFYVPSFNSGWMSFSKRPGKNTPQCYTKPLDSLKNWNNRFFWVDEKVFPTTVEWRVEAPKDLMPIEGSYSIYDVVVLNTRRTPIQKQPEDLLCLVGLSRRYFLGDDVYLTFLDDDDREMDLFNLISGPNPNKVKVGNRPRAAHEVPLLTATANRVITMEDATAASGQEVKLRKHHRKKPPPPSHKEVVATVQVAPEPRLEKEVVAIGSSMNKRRRKRGNAEAEATAPPKVLRKDYASIYPGQSTRRGKSLTAMEFEVGIPAVAPTTQETPTGAKGVIDPDPLSYAKPRPALERDVTRVQEGARRRGSRVEEVNLLYIYGSVTKEYLSAWVGSQQLSPGYSGCVSGRGGSHSTTGVAMGSQLRLRSVKVEVQGLRDQSKNLGTLLEAEVDMRNAAEAKNTELAKELDSLRAKFSNLQVNSNQLSQQVTTLQVQVTCEEIIKAAFEEFKRYEDDRVKKRCVEMDTRLDALSVDFDEELYPHMQTAVAGRRWVIGHGLCLAIMKCAESMELRHAFADVVSDGLVKAIEAYDPEADTKFTTALQALKDLKYPLVDQLEQLKDAPIDLIMASLHLESDTGEDAPSFICDLRPSSSQLKIHVYPEVRDLKDP